jgi:hypothetical protein
MKLLFVLLFILANALASADVPSSDTTEVHAVMFELAYDKDGAIRHAQVIAGYASLDACKDAMRTVMGRATVVEDGLTPQLECQGVRVTPKEPTVPGEESL